MRREKAHAKPMSFSTEMLQKAQAAYEQALTHRLTQFGDKRHEYHAIEQLRGEVLYWEKRVAAETAAATGTSAYKPIQVVL